MQTIEITGCKDCPACESQDMVIGFKCRLSDNDILIEVSDDNYEPAYTPNWCPLKSEDIMLTFDKENAEEPFYFIDDDLSPVVENPHINKPFKDLLK